MMADTQHDLNRIYSLIGSSNTPLSMRDVCFALGNLTRATAIRRLNDLVEAGAIEVVGKGRSTRYKTFDGLPLKLTVSVSLDAIDVENYVSRPVETKRFVGYNRSFLDEYKPNSSQYFPDVLLDRLHQIGRLSDETSYRSESENSRRLCERFLIDISHASSKLEGANTNYLQTERLIQLSADALSRADRETVTLILNHKNAIEFILGSARSPGLVPVGFNRNSLSNVHSNLTRGLLADPESIGRIRRRPVDVSESSYTPESAPLELEDTLNQILETCEQIKDPFEQSFFALVHLSYIQAFEDGNKRTSRIMANIPLMKADLCPISFLGTPERAYINGILGVYELNRTELMRDVYVSTYTLTASHFHGEYDRTIVPDELSFRYRDDIDGAVRFVVRKQPEDPLNAIDEWALEFDHLDTKSRDNLKYLVIEQCRSLTEPLSNILHIEPEMYTQWDTFRRTYYNEIEIRDRVGRLN